MFSCEIDNPTEYRSLAGVLQYLTFTRHDIIYGVQQVYFFMHAPTMQHMHALKWIICYVQGTLTLRLQLFRSSLNELVAYSHVDWAGCSDTCYFTSLRQGFVST